MTELILKILENKVLGDLKNTMCSLCAEMWFHLVESDRFIATFLHGTVTHTVDLNTRTRTRTHTHTLF